MIIDILSGYYATDILFYSTLLLLCDGLMLANYTFFVQNYCAATMMRTFICLIRVTGNVAV